MRRPSPVTQYLVALGLEFSFDVPLWRRVRQEVEDHLLSAAEASGDKASAEAQRQAIARFGQPADIARRYATQSLSRQSSRVGTSDFLAFCAVFIGMKARDAAFGLPAPPAKTPLQFANAVGLTIDHYAILAALISGLLGLVCIWRRRPASSWPGYRRHLRRCLGLLATTSGALLVAVVTDAALTALRLWAAAAPAIAPVPAVSVALEIGLAVVLACQVTRLIRHARPGPDAAA